MPPSFQRGNAADYIAYAAHAKRPPEAMKNHFRKDTLSEIFHTHPHFLVEYLNKVEEHRLLSELKTRKRFGRIAKERVEIADHRKRNPAMEIELKEWEDGLTAEENMIKRRKLMEQDVDERYLPVTAHMDVISEHFVRHLLKGAKEVVDHDHQVMLDHGGGHYIPNRQSREHPPNCDCDFCMHPMTMSPLMKRKPIFDDRGIHQGYEREYGNFYDSPGHPPGPPNGVQPHHGPSGASMFAWKMLKKGVKRGAFAAAI